MKNLFLVSISFFLILASCKKYAEGPTVSILPRKERIEGKWIAQSVKYNNNDSTSVYKNHIWEFTRNYSVILQIQSTKILGNWATITNDNDFQITYDDGIVETYEILKMERTEFWLRNKKTQLEFRLQSQ